ncbi:hypothetical protein C8Q70DRAFT_1037672 [Cubamyces menziesii]|nr:hypothetical protein C8Q70DRAFT_1037672 [Cubamyces menziesii]
MACLRSASYLATVLRHTGHAVYTAALAMHNERCTVVFLASPACQCPLHLYICSLIALASDSRRVCGDVTAGYPGPLSTCSDFYLAASFALLPLILVLVIGTQQ